MDAIQLILGFFMLACASDPSVAVQGRNIEYERQTHHCLEGTFETFVRVCRNNTTYEAYTSRPFVLREAKTGRGFYLNQFGEVMASTSGNLFLNAIYVPECAA